MVAWDIMESIHTKSSQNNTVSNWPSQILMKVGELVDFIQNSILAKFQYCMSCCFVVQGRKNKRLKFWTATSTKIIITFVRYGISCNKTMNMHKL
jgi:hypothetical protein